MSNATKFVSPFNAFNDARYAKAAPTVKTDEDLLKGVRKYTRTARKAWEAMSIPEDQEVDFDGKPMVPPLNG